MRNNIDRAIETHSERREFWAMIDRYIRNGQKDEADVRIAQREKMHAALRECLPATEDDVREARIAERDDERVRDFDRY